MKRNVLVGQSGGPTSVINSSLAGVFQTAKNRGLGKVYGMRHGIQGLLERRYVLLDEQITGSVDIELLKRTPSAFLGSCRFKLPEPKLGDPIFETIFEIMEELEIGFFFYIGGNDSMDTIKKLYDYDQLLGAKSGVCFIGVPKTIDNDLAVTDHTPGFGSAAKYIATVAKEVIRDGLVYDIPLVTIIEIMGRNAGWLTGAAALAKDEDCEGVDLIYLPELPFDVEAFIEKVKELQKTKKAVVVAISEGARTKDGQYVCQLTDSANSKVDAFGHAALAGTAHYLANRLMQATGSKVRAVELSSLQRCASHLASRVDNEEAFLVGGSAVNAAVEGKSGNMVTLNRVSSDPYICVTDTYDVHMIANVEKTVPREWINEAGDNMLPEFVQYVQPLIQGEMSHFMTVGLSRHLRLK